MRPLLVLTAFALACSSSRKSVREDFAVSAQDERQCGGLADEVQTWRDHEGLLDSSSSTHAVERELRDCLDRARRPATVTAAAAAAPAPPREDRPEFVVPALSAKLCRYAAWRAAIVDDAQREQRYAAETGVANLSRLENDKTVMREIDAAADRWAQPFAGSASRPLPCSDHLVSRITPCVYVDAGGGFGPLWAKPPDAAPQCSSPEIRPYLSALNQ